MADGVGSVLTPSHPGQLQALAHHRLAGALHRAAADAPTPSQVFGVFHPVGIPLEVTDQLGGRFAHPRSTWPIPVAQNCGQQCAPFVLEQLSPLAREIFGVILVLGCTNRASPVSFSAGWKKSRMTTSTRGKFSRIRSSRPLPPSLSPIHRSARSMPTWPAGLRSKGPKASSG